MNVTITPGLLRGAITPPPSKSQAHRLLIAAALADGESRIEHLADSQDIQATRRCMAALKAPGEDLPVLDCGESGSTLRFLIPVALALRGGGRFTGRGRLMERPQKPYFDLFDEKGIAYRQEDGVLTVQGRLTPGTFALPGDVSSQFVTGLLYALPLLEGDSRITLTTPLESRGYVDMTLEALERFGIRAECPDGRTLRVPGGQTYRPCRAAVESDYSQAAFYYAANGLGGQVEILGLNPRSAQGDRCIVPYHMQLCGPGEAELDVSQCPDLVPPLAAHAALRQGITRIVNAARLRIKESDRLTAVTQVLTALGADVVEGADRLTITGQPEGLAGGVTVDSHNDHRIAMMAAVAATRCAAPVTITGAECVAKSYPDFWEDYERLGGQIQRS
ncbi:3-phosphoshikimate 1-carboxyvinyltransferase [Intestinimonas massiliensis]|uniref:3-phosphoshikimate 1-carboxyvinyltransferase n=1 Tax=Intestinimonas massiliensis (ex Afouda et al. 2020) TaxID=1673721 RepID=A0AAW5JR47_9FIRM|nr:3-phosphoshikimate 1-carboxyvinyltransferase [Intestinimonas massiliensis (ex Afouda et al. 2020)]MCQ4770394.1 3-phosphoshikimate 1-carboxyvinyltransferase [Intestinimonas massiliensis (ex Afouda et al. 2020)]